MITATHASTVAHTRAQLQHLEMLTDATLQAAHTQAVHALKPVLNTLYKQIGAMQQSGQQSGLAWLYSVGHLHSIQNAVHFHIDQFSKRTRDAVDDLQLQAAKVGIDSSRSHLEKATGKALVAYVGHVEAHMTNTSTRHSPLFAQFGSQAASGVTSALVRGVSLGTPVKQIVADVAKALDNVLQRALVIAGEAMTAVFRGVTHATMQANSDVAAGWIWVAELDGTPSPCFPAGTMIQTEYGEKPIERVEIGEKVLTHTGQYKRVLETHKRPYQGELYSFSTDDAFSKVTATSEHPFLVERQGKLDWIKARDIRLRDHVIRQFQDGSEIRDHSVGSGAIERHVGQSDNAISSRLQPKRFLDVTRLYHRRGMPVHAINFKTCIERWQKEINGIMPAWERIFLPILNTQCLETQPSTAFRFGLAGMASVAYGATENPITQFYRHNAKLFSAIPAIYQSGRASAFLRTKFPILTSLKDFTAPFTSMGICLNNSDRLWLVSSPYIEAIKRAELLIVLRRRYCECFTAIQARYNGFMGNTALLSTVFPRATRNTPKLFSAPLAGAIQKRLSFLASSGMRMFTLVKSIASPRAETPIAPFCPSVGDGKDFIALSACHFHTSIITHIATHIQHIPVYNLGVEDDNSYVANGYVVHNCIACILMHGTRHPLSAILMSHVRCRCQMVTYFADNPDIAGQSGTDWFLAQDAQTQQEIMGMAKWKAWKSGTFPLSAILGTEPDGTVYVKSLKELGVRT